MSELRDNQPDLTFDGGHLELNAEKVEKRLSEIWQQVSAGYKSEMPIAKICLSNMLVVTDALARPEAEQLANEVALKYPSRVFLLIVDELQGAYSAFVRTSCSKDAESGTIRCFEVVELLADISRIDFLPGALRSLLVGSVPVITVDLRAYQTTPQFDNTILDLSDYYYVNAGVVPSGRLEKRYLPLRWYSMLPVRELIGDLLGRVNASDCNVRPTIIRLYSVPSVDRCSDLLAGWLLARLRSEHPRQQKNRIIAAYREYQVEIEMVEQGDTTRIAEIQFSDGAIASITNPAAGEFAASFGKVHLRQTSSGMPLSSYLVEAMQDGSEFAEYSAVVDALDRIAQH